MSAAGHEKAPGRNPEAVHSTVKSDCRIPAAGFVALGHLLHAARTLHALPALPDDAIQAARILLSRITADVARLGGGE